jgi:hypothetical protein
MSQEKEVFEVVMAVLLRMLFEYFNIITVIVGSYMTSLVSRLFFAYHK